MSELRPAPQLCVGAVAVEANRLLMVRRGQNPGAGRWSIPGGHVEPGETMAEAVVRELREETGVRGVCQGLVGWLERTGPDHHLVILDFEVTVAGTEELAPGDDATDAAWVPLEEVRQLAVVDGLVQFLEDHAILAGD
ncbi:MAG: NUDIX domain-containing protein [Actinomycetota bacterium]|nr:NUDIX domain-containing protein [Actinomycetota bacterium]MDQ3681262.1 NUDIX domain-containing protein [Actinomycetota bacterium]